VWSLPVGRRTRTSVENGWSAPPDDKRRPSGTARQRYRASPCLPTSVLRVPVKRRTYESDRVRSAWSRTRPPRRGGPRSPSGRRRGLGVELVGGPTHRLHAKEGGVVEQREPVSATGRQLLGEHKHVDVAPGVEVAACDRTEHDHTSHGHAPGQRFPVLAGDVDTLLSFPTTPVEDRMRCHPDSPSASRRSVPDPRSCHTASTAPISRSASAVADAASDSGSGPPACRPGGRPDTGPECHAGSAALTRLPLRPMTAVRPWPPRPGRRA